MLMGLCMSCFLIGGLWFLIGIGDAIVFRDAMQEATDHAAFTTAVLHAKGMNFISACNLILFALIAIHIVMGLIHDILLSLCIAGAVSSGGTACLPWTQWRPIYTAYGSGFKQVATAVHQLEQTAAGGYPFLALAKANSIGKDYGEFGPKRHDVRIVALGTSMVEGNALVGPVDRIFRTKNARPKSEGRRGSKSFLPVEPKHFDDVCKRVATKSVDFLVGLTAMSARGAAAPIFDSFISGGIVARFCNDLGSADNGAAMEDAGKAAADGAAQAARSQPNRENKGDSGLDPGFDSWWGQDGPLVPWGGTSNGSPWQQVWALNLEPEFSDAQQHRVHIAVDHKDTESDANVWGYFAQAEFFFDCQRAWSDPDCNGGANAGYSMKWRAKLRRVQRRELGALLDAASGELFGGPAAKKSLDKLLEQPGTPKGEKERAGLQTVLDNLFGITKGGKGSPPLEDEVYH